jgi:glutaredoxin
MKSRFLPLIIFVVFISVLFYCLDKPVSRLHISPQKLQLEDFEMLTFDNLPPKFNGPYAVHVFSPYCLQCKFDKEVLKKAAVPTIGLVFERDTGDLKEVLQKYLTFYKVILIPKSSRIITKMGIRGVPQTMVVDEKFFIVYNHFGALNKEIVDNVVSSFNLR